MKVSIIMATYNCEKTINRCIDSILNQTYDDWELIICDDCSVDATYSILKDYADRYKDKIIVLKNEKNSKLSYSLNRCLDVSSGEYIARMDGDDWSGKERIAVQVRFLDQHPEYAVVGTAMQAFNEKGNLYVMYAGKEPKASELINGTTFFHATIMMRKTVYDDIGRYVVSKRTERGQDYDMWFRFFNKGYKGYNLQNSLYHVQIDNNAYNRRSIRTRLYEVQTKIIGYHLIHIPFYKYLLAFKPIVVALIPNSLMKRYHDEHFKK